MKEKCVGEGEEWKTCKICLYCESITNNVWVPSKNREKRLLVLSCLSVRPHGATRLPMPGFSWHLISEYFLRATRKQQEEEKKKIIVFLKSVEKIEVSLKSGNNNGTVHADRYTLLIISRSVLLRMRNVWDRSCRENQNTRFAFRYFVPETRVAVERIWKNMIDPGRPRITV